MQKSPEEREEDLRDFLICTAVGTVAASKICLLSGPAYWACLFLGNAVAAVDCAVFVFAL